MGNLAAMEKRDREERLAFQSNMARGVKSMLGDFSRARREMARRATSERQALLLGIRKRVTGLRQETAKGREPLDTPKLKAVVMRPSKVDLLSEPRALASGLSGTTALQAVEPPATAPIVKTVEASVPVARKVDMPKAKAFESAVTTVMEPRKQPKKDRLRAKSGKARRGRK